MPSFSRGVAVVVLTSVALWCASVLRSSWRRSPPGSAADAHEPPAALSAIRRAITAGEGGVETAVGEAVRLILGEAGATTENPRQNFVEQRSGQADDEPALPRRHAMLLSPPPPLTPHLLRPHRRQLAHRFPVQRPNSSSHEAGAVAAVYEGSATSAGSAIERVLAGAAGSTSLRALHAKAQRLRIYVYRPPRSSSGWCATNLTAQHKKCKTFQWSGDWELIQRMRRSDQYTTDGDAADFYVVPFLSKCYYNFEAKYGLRRMDVALREVMRYLKWHSWWGARPERHLFFFLSGIGAGVVPSWRAHISRSIFIVAEGDREAPYFREGQDIVVPGKIAISRAERPLPPRKRKKLVGVFRGSLDALLRDERGARVRRKNKLRHLLFETLRGNRRYIFSGRKSKHYVEEMDHARYCIIPRGNTPWTRRFFDAAVRGCIPAVLSDPVAFPFERLLDFTSMTIKLPEQWAEKLSSELERVNATAASRLQAALVRASAAFVYGEGGCAFEFFLMELAARKHGFYRGWTAPTPGSMTTFWSPTRGRFDLPSARKVGPSWGAGATEH